MFFKWSQRLLQQEQIVSKVIARSSPTELLTSQIKEAEYAIPFKVSEELNLPSLFYSKPNISLLSLKSIIQSHKMESQYLSNISNYKPHYYNNSPVSIWHRLPIFRRSAVLILLFLGKSGELRVILTRRSRKLSSFSGHACLPGGRADNGLESEWHTARRETEEEIGISQNDLQLKELFGCSIEQINILPSYLSRTFLAVRPCVGFLKWSPSKLSKFEEQHLSSILLNPGESASIYSVPLKEFMQPYPRNEKRKECLKLSYTKTKWGGLTWHLRSFLFPIINPNEVRWLEEVEDLSSEEELDDGVKARDVWGLTANILHDLAMIAYKGPHDGEIAEEELIYSLMSEGNQFSTKKRSEFEVSMLQGERGVSFKDKMTKETFEHLKNLYS